MVSGEWKHNLCMSVSTFFIRELLPLVRLNVVKLLKQNNCCVSTACETKGMCSADGCYRSCKHPSDAHLHLLLCKLKGWLCANLFFSPRFSTPRGWFKLLICFVGLETGLNPKPKPNVVSVSSKSNMSNCIQLQWTVFFFLSYSGLIFQTAGWPTVCTFHFHSPPANASASLRSSALELWQKQEVSTASCP